MCSVAGHSITWLCLYVWGSECLEAHARAGMRVDTAAVQQLLMQVCGQRLQHTCICGCGCTSSSNSYTLLLVKIAG